MGIIYKDGAIEGSVTTQILSEDLNLINRALGLNAYEGNNIYCPDMKCYWLNQCHWNQYQNQNNYNQTN